jgi:ABC-2 type transport system permease protein
MDWSPAHRFTRSPFKMEPQMNKALVVLRKEWLDLRQDTTLLLSTLVPPIILTVLPIAVTYLLGRVPDDDTAQLGIAAADPTLAGLSNLELGQAVIGKQFALLFLLMPLFIPSIIAAYSIVGEKANRTLEPLLAAPVRTVELLLGKALAALIPAVALTWACGAVFAAGIASVALSARVFAVIVTPAWLILLLVCAPLLSLIAIAASVAVSSRVNDPRTAQQLSGVVVVPILLIFFGQLAGVLVLSPALSLGATAVLAVVAALAIWGATRLFQREMILTRWS